MIPNHQLVVPYVDVDEQGHLQIVDETERSVLLWQNANDSTDMPLLGRAFLSSAYMFVDNEKKEFTLWSSVPNTTSDVVALGLQTCETSLTPSAGAPTSTDPTNSSIWSTSQTLNPTSSSVPTAPSSPPSRPFSSRNKNRKIVIVGATVGAVAGFSLCSWAIYAFIRRSKLCKQPDHVDQQQRNFNPQIQPQSNTSPSHNSTTTPQEMPLEQNPGISPYEVNGIAAIELPVEPHGIWSSNYR